MQDLFFKVYNRLGKMNSNRLFSGIRNTPPMKTKPDADVILYCALDKPNYRAYILAVKSFLRFYPDICVVAQGDGSLDDASTAEIREHLIGVEIHTKRDMLEGIARNAEPELSALLPGEAMYDTKVPVRIMYLKFLNVVLRMMSRRVIIIDSDLVFLRRPDAIIDWIESPYTNDFYGEGSNSEARRYYDLGFEFESLDIANFSSGTIGVGGSFDQEELIGIFRTINEKAPELFNAWEIEQAMWSILMSRRPNPLNLDELRDVYIGSGWRSYKDLNENAVIAHFAGAIRFKNNRYLRLAHGIMKDLRSRPA